jgi:hypothetical protein
MKTIAKITCCVISAIVVAACGAGKLAETPIDYGAEDAAEASLGKDDSATSPATMVSIGFDETLRTTFTSTRRWRAFQFKGNAGDRIEILLDGLRGLDTIVYLYKASRYTGRPYGKPIASNDDTEQADWTLRSNTSPNELSSSIIDFKLWDSRDYVIVATTYQQAGRGAAEVAVRKTASEKRIALIGGPEWRVSTTRASRWQSPSFDDSHWESPATPAPEACGWTTITPEYLSRNKLRDWEHEGAPTMWATEQGRYAYFRKTFEIPASATVTRAMVTTVADDDHEVFVNGTRVVSDHDFASGPVFETDIARHLRPGMNVIAILGDDSVGGCRNIGVNGSVWWR